MPRLFLVVVITAMWSCESSTKPSTSFYYWKTIFRLSPEEKSAIAQNNVGRLYVRYCDVVLKNNAAVPESPIVFDEQPENISIVPVIYIKNEVMLRADLDVTDLAEKIISFVEQINARHDLSAAELQIDCDWTEKSKTKYFEFLEQVNAKRTFKLSATIRLHQIKYPEVTGIPPVEKGVLMYYNMGRIAADHSNSIYERSIATRYLDRLHEYPLPLDLALPIFGWGIHIRNHRVIGLLRDVDANTFLNDKHFEPLTAPFFETKENTFKKGNRFQSGDRIKIESVSADDLSEIIKDLGPVFHGRPTEVIFYDLDNFNLKQFEHEPRIFEEISADF